MAGSTGSPCAACKFLRRKCTAECVFAAYFPPEDPQKFANVHKLFGASNVSKLLNELPQCARDDTVNSLAYEAEARIKDPVYGCAGAISILQSRVAQLQAELAAARSELCKLKGHSSNDPLLQCKSDYLPSPHCNQPHQMSSPYISLLQSKHQQAVIQPSSPSVTPSFAPTLQVYSIPCPLAYPTSSTSTFPDPTHSSSSLANHTEVSSSPSPSSSTQSFFNIMHPPDCASAAGHTHASSDANQYAGNLASSSANLHMLIPTQLGLLLPHYITPSRHHNIDSSSSSNTNTAATYNYIARTSSSSSYNVAQVVKLEPQNSHN